MHHWTRRLFALAAPLLLTGCLWGPGKFASDLTLGRTAASSSIIAARSSCSCRRTRRAAEPWSTTWRIATIALTQPIGAKRRRPLHGKSRNRRQRNRHAKSDLEKAAKKRKESEDMAKMFGLPGLDDASNRAFAAKLTKYAGWRSVTYRGNGVFDVDYHFEGRADAGLPLSGAARQQSDHSVHRAPPPRRRLGAGHGARVHRRFGADERRDGRRMATMGEGRPVSRAPGPLHRRSPTARS